MSVDGVMGIELKRSFVDDFSLVRGADGGLVVSFEAGWDVYIDGSLCGYVDAYYWYDAVRMKTSDKNTVAVDYSYDYLGKGRQKCCFVERVLVFDGDQDVFDVPDVLKKFFCGAFAAPDEERDARMCEKIGKRHDNSDGFFDDKGFGVYQIGV